ncbi:MAG: hypothetical protein DRQ45_06125 [Gammaproteobacteria bacterium]|nr:MAG: hypothetical protein DRQ45_06125 [Gammaproteobacteria bacterium]
MLTDGTLMRLSKKDFVELLKKPLVHHIDYELATAVIKDGGIWLDVRLPDEHSNHAFENSKNVPLASIRDKASTLTTSKKYVIYCDTGRRSAAAAFLLSQRGLDVCVLEGGLNTGLPAGVFGLTLDMPVDASPEPAAEVLSLVEPDEATVTGDQGTDLQTALSALETEFTAYDKVVKQMQAACTEEEQARVALSQKLDQLKSLVASAASKK